MFELEKGKISVIMDAQAGSSGKGKLAAYIFDKHFDEWDFACNAFYPQAGHWVRLGDGKNAFFYQTLNSCAWMWREYPDRMKDKIMFIGPGSIIELPALLREIKENNIPVGSLWIDDKALILQDDDTAYERGEKDFAGNTVTSRHDGTMKFGSTSHGVGACAAKRVLRDPRMVTAGDRIDVLYGYTTPSVSDIIMDLTINQGKRGILEVAQGFQLSLNGRFFPYTTSRNCTVAQGFSDMFLPVTLFDKLVLNFRTFPIRINSKKYLSKEDGHHLTYEEIMGGVPYEIYEGNSGGWYEDQKEITWEQLTKDSGSSIPLMELTSVTKLPRRVATFSKMNLKDSILNGVGDEVEKVFLSLNFANYVDASLLGVTDHYELEDNERFCGWMKENFPKEYRSLLQWVGTGPYHNQMVEFGDSPYGGY